MLDTLSIMLFHHFYLIITSLLSILYSILPLLYIYPYLIIHSLIILILISHSQNLILFPSLHTLNLTSILILSFFISISYSLLYLYLLFIHHSYLKPHKLHHHLSFYSPSYFHLYYILSIFLYQLYLINLIKVN